MIFTNASLSKHIGGTVCFDRLDKPEYKRRNYRLQTTEYGIGGDSPHGVTGTAIKKL